MNVKEEQHWANNRDLLALPCAFYINKWIGVIHLNPLNMNKVELDCITWDFGSAMWLIQSVLFVPFELQIWRCL